MAQCPKIFLNNLAHNNESKTPQDLVKNCQILVTRNKSLKSCLKQPCTLSKKKGKTRMRERHQYLGRNQIEGKSI